MTKTIFVFSCNKKEAMLVIYEDICNVNAVSILSECIPFQFCLQSLLKRLYNVWNAVFVGIASVVHFLYNVRLVWLTLFRNKNKRNSC